MLRGDDFYFENVISYRVLLLLAAGGTFAEREKNPNEFFVCRSALTR